ncbi:hypothetical protein K4K49_012692 [Colletotrichum sp. SAR 10_70]|nr:hypothetical protein K4K50_002698 [Colletotrichum sp. SAR 10_71]KAI8188682.1 hypothetical protein K4K49_012692 [Colletotrichum sp. SAR 10_70]KAI8210049.1 hypothetical protein K4K52_012788 [Colletotrichum sp. SAR 10_76]KAI8251601.1 hypothetical protein K4K53_012022 [Colletotrichum sp. SAR 10_77]
MKLKWPRRSSRDSPLPEAPGSTVRPAAPWGIDPLHDRGASAVADIVFVHGLNGHREETWTAPGETEPWPKTLLPKEITDARVLTFGYDASVADWKGVVGQSRIANHASNLLNALANFRDKDDTALVSSLQRPQRHLQAILASTKGIIFLGTPHHGSGLAIWAERLSKSIGLIKQTNADIVQVLRRDSEVLARIQDSFHTMIQSRTKQGLSAIEITCFYEELPMRGVGLVVPPDSAILPGYIPIGIHSDHSGMTKFASVKDPGFTAVCDELRRWVRELRNAHAPSRLPSMSQEMAGESAPKGQGESELPAGYFIVPYSKNPDFVGRNHILDDLKRGLDHRSLSTQSKGKANARPRLCLYGLGGVGKSQIALAYAYWLKDIRPDISVFWVYSGNADRFRQAYVDIARECKIPGHDSPSVDILSLVKAWLQSKSHDPWLLIIDNADDPDVFFPRAFNGDRSSPPRAEHGRDGKNAALAQFIPQCTCGNGSVLFTTRNKQAGLKLSSSPASLIEVDQMNDRESVEMIRALVGNNQISDEIASGLSERLEKLPLAIAQASAFIQENSMSAGDYLERLDRGDDDIVRLLSEDFRTVGRDDDVPRAVMLTFAISFEQIEREQPLATEILSLIAFFDRQAIPQSLLNDGLAEPWFEDFEYYLSNRAYFDTMKRLKDVGDDENWYNEAEGSLRASNRNGKDRESEDVAEDFNNVRSVGPVDLGDCETDYYLATERDRETLSNSGTSYYNPTCLFSSTQNKESSQARNVTTTPYLRKITPPADYSPRRSIDEIEFQKAIGKLRAFSIVSQGENKDISVHRLVQLATRHWLRKRGSDGIFAERALRAIAQAFPFPRYAQLRACQSLLPHAKEILKNKPSDTYNVALLRAILSENLAHFFFDCGRVELRSMARDEGLQATLGEGHPLLTARKVLQAGILTTAGQAQETTKMISRALFLQRQVDPDNLGYILFLKDQLAVALTAERRFQEAINLLTSALRQCEGRHDLRGIRVQLSIRLGWTFKETNELRRAEEILAKTAEEHKANPAPQEHEAEAAHDYKAEHPQMLACSVRLAQVLIMQNRLVEAEQLCRRCLLQDQDVQLNISTRGPLADAKHQLSLCLLRQGRLKDAEESIRQLLQISTDGDNMFVTYKETLCIILEKQGRWKEAERTRGEVLRLLAGRFEQNHPGFLRNRPQKILNNCS